MEQMLKRIFDYQRFSPNGHLSAIISDAEGCCRALDDEALSLVAAAGEADITNRLLEKKDEHAGKYV